MKWNQAIRDYSHYLKIERGLSQNTIDNYGLDIKKLVSYLDTHSLTVSPLSIDHHTVQEFVCQVVGDLE